MDSEARKKANLRVLQRLDKSIVDICGSATHVVLYEFSSSNQQWDKLDVEGSLFCVQRKMNDSFNYQLIVLNRTSTNNWIQQLSSELQMQVRDPYLMVKDGSSIRGIWFHNAQERSDMAQLLQRIKKEGYSSTIAPGNEKNNPVTTTASTATTQSYSSKVQGNTATGNEQPLDTKAAAAALMASLSIKPTPMFSHSQAGAMGTERGGPVPSRPHASPPPTASANTTAPTLPLNNANGPMILDKKNLQLSLLSLIQDDRFLELIHDRYVKVVQTKAKREQQGNTQSMKNAK